MRTLCGISLDEVKREHRANSGVTESGKTERPVQLLPGMLRRRPRYGERGTSRRTIVGRCWARGARSDGAGCGGGRDDTRSDARRLWGCSAREVLHPESSDDPDGRSEPARPFASFRSIEQSTIVAIDVEQRALDRQRTLNGGRDGRNGQTRIRPGAGRSANRPLDSDHRQHHHH